MNQVSNDKLTVKESWTAGKIRGKLNKGQKQVFDRMSISEKRDIIAKFNNNIPFEVEEIERNQETKYKIIEKTLNKRELNTMSESGKDMLLKNKVGQFIDSFSTRFSSSFSNPNNAGQMFTYEMINQNFVLIEMLDEHLKNENKIIEQNNEIIELLKQIANKGA
ncbi:TPA: hypothetical protein SI259_000409 [Staphylococcus aureus]|uniref:hypothetical protein n=1 Tax=Staphylococcus aureus TaxID=1280 RepID=UPI002025D1DA|nr:hypothetical protein [Staphylococcus aureus]MCL9693167.1 hypothetical protein [Staphylococcus aureus]HEI2155650.1 hypothetical protein [Staphylococcus aureus]